MQNIFAFFRIYNTPSELHAHGEAQSAFLASATYDT